MQVAASPSALSVKDHLFNLINSAEDRETLITVIETVIIPVLENTQGMWVELSYCYKASEIAIHAGCSMSKYDGACAHHKTHEKINRLQCHLLRLDAEYRQLKYENGCL